MGLLMARASGIWVVANAYPDADLILGAFTVKWELARWLKKQPDATRFLVTRYQDGCMNCLDHPGTRVPIHELLQMTTY